MDLDKSVSASQQLSSPCALLTRSFVETDHIIVQPLLIIQVHILAKKIGQDERRRSTQNVTTASTQSLDKHYLIAAHKTLTVLIFTTMIYDH